LGEIIFGNSEKRLSKLPTHTVYIDKVYGYPTAASQRTWMVLVLLVSALDAPPPPFQLLGMFVAIRSVPRPNLVSTTTTTTTTIALRASLWVDSQQAVSRVYVASSNEWKTIPMAF
jgi:hypothetical protein